MTVGNPVEGSHGSRLPGQPFHFHPDAGIASVIRDGEEALHCLAGISMPLHELEYNADISKIQLLIEYVLKFIVIIRLDKVFREQKAHSL